MKNQKRQIFAAGILFLMILLLTACGGGGGNDAYVMTESAAPIAAEAEYYDYDDDMNYSGASLSRADAPMEMSYSSANAAQSSGNRGAGNADNSDSANETRPRKMIFSASITLETTEFDKTAQALENLVEQMGGYFSDSTAGDRGSSHRWGNYTARIPAAKFNLFLQQAGELAHETWRNVTRQDVSESYYDADGRLKTQKAKLDRLQELLEKAETVEDMITIESAMADTEYQIDSLSGELRHYDNLVDYSTIDISLEEVYRLTDVEQIPESYGSLLASAFTGGLRNFGNWLEDLTIAIAYNWIWIVLLIVIAFVFIKLGRAGKLSLNRKNARNINLSKDSNHSGDSGNSGGSDS